MTERIVYPFSAIVAQDTMKVALLLNAVDPRIGGVLIRGHKGTGKSTAARGIARLLPPVLVAEGCPFHSDPRQPVAVGSTVIAGLEPGKPRRAISRPTPFVELPLNATEDRLAGTLHLERTLEAGRREFEPGLLAAANRGVLYVDEVNLLDDHLVDLLLDAAASGVNVVEREGLSFVHPSRFMLIGTMNPEEGELRPQLLDRFGLCAAVGHITDTAARETIVQRHLAFEADPERFTREWEREDRFLAEQVRLARGGLEQVGLPPSRITLVAEMTRELGVQGHRADITTIKAARAHAAFLEKAQVDLEDIAAAARLALPHRIAASPLDSPETLRETIDRALQRVAGGTVGSEAPFADAACGESVGLAEDLDEMAEQMQVPGATAAGSILLSFVKKKSGRQCSSPTTG